MRRLPSEILSEIFGHSSDPPTSFDPRNSMPWRIIQVCSRWRDVALASPLLWCRFSLRGYRSRGLDDTGISREISLQLQRSSQAPLSIYMEDQYNALDLFLAASTRWQDVTLFLNLQQYQHLFASGADFPILKKLSITTSQSLHWSATDVARFFDSLPALEELALNAGCIEMPSYLPLPWARLRKCTFTVCQASDILRFLSFVSPGTDVYITVLRTNGIELPSHVSSPMRSLTIDYSMYLSAFLSYLTAPLLEELVIEEPEFRRDSNANVVQQIVAFLTRSACSLARLRIRWNLDEPDLLKILACPSVHGLIALDIAGESTQISVEAIDAAATCLTHLRELSLPTSLTYDSTDAELLAMVANRHPALRSLRLKGRRLSQESLEKLRGDGLEVVMKR
ncbi:hypothetical protein C8R44DRAFT_814186 [Mycena epipterygia]|nr:hypothetical protein C8R44DRAFT_814186 [Mycena epipterygia]